MRAGALALWRARGGAAAIEFALIAPLFLALVCGTIELSRWAWGAAEVRDRAARAARCIAVTGAACAKSDAIKAGAIRAGAMRFERSACGVRVVVTGGFPAVLTPGLGLTRAVACAG